MGRHGLHAGNLHSQNLDLRISQTIRSLRIRPPYTLEVLSDSNAHDYD